MDDNWVEIDKDVSFPEKPPVETRLDGTIIEHEPGAAADIVGQVERLGVMDEGQIYALTIGDITGLIAAHNAGRVKRVHKILDRSHVDDEAAAQIHQARAQASTNDEGDDGQGDKADDGFRPFVMRELELEDETLDQRLERLEISQEDESEAS